MKKKLNRKVKIQHFHLKKFCPHPIQGALGLPPPWNIGRVNRGRNFYVYDIVL